MALPVMATGHQSAACLGTGIALLGSTGSIGVSTLDVIRASGGNLRTVLLSGHSNIDLLFRQALEFSPRWLVVTDSQAASRHNWIGLPKDVELLVGEEALTKVIGCPEIDVVVAAI